MEVFRNDQSKVDTLTGELTALTKLELKLIQQKKTANKDYDGLLAQMDSLMGREHLMLDRVGSLEKNKL